MEQNTGGNEKISIMEILKEGFYLYKNNFKLFISISFIGFLINAFVITFGHLQHLSSSTTYGLIYSIANLVIVLLNIYFSVVVTISLIVCISKRYQSIDTTFQESYKYAKTRFWRYFGASMLVFLIMIIPFIGIIGVLLSPSAGSIKYIIFAICVCIIIYISTYFSFTTYIACLEDENAEYLRKSVKLVKAYFLKILIITFLSSTIFSLPSFYLTVIKLFNEISIISEYLVKIVSPFISLIVLPFSNSVMMVVYYRLKDIKDIKFANDVL